MHRQEDVLLRRGIDAEEFGRGDSGNGERVVVDQHRFADRFGDVAKPSLRVAVADDCCGGRARAVVCRNRSDGRRPEACQVPRRMSPETYWPPASPACP